MASIAEASSLFEIDVEIDGLLEEIEGQVESEGQAAEDLVARFHQFCEAHGEKVDRIGRFVRIMEAREQYCRSESVRLADRARAAAGKVERTKNMVLYYLLSRDLKKIEGGQFTLRAQKTYSVLSEIFDDPVWSEKLCGRRDVLTGNYLADHFIFLFRNVKLVQPANNLYLLPVLLIDFTDKLSDERIRIEQVTGQQQFSFIVDSFEQERHGGVKGIALRCQQQPIQFILFVARQLEVNNHVVLQACQSNMLGLFQDFRRRFTVGMTQNPIAMFQVAMQFHEPDSDQPIEPSVGYCLHRRLKAMPCDALFELLAFAGDGARMLPASDYSHVALLKDGFDLVRC